VSQSKRSRRRPQNFWINFEIRKKLFHKRFLFSLSLFFISNSKRTRSNLEKSKSLIQLKKIGSRIFAHFFSCCSRSKPGDRMSLRNKSPKMSATRFIVKKLGHSWLSPTLYGFRYLCYEAWTLDLVLLSCTVMYLLSPFPRTDSQGPTQWPNFSSGPSVFGHWGT
jgi:hypothetical protein